LPGAKFRDKSHRVLRFIALKGPANKRQIEMAVRPRIDHPTIHKIVLDLNVRKMVELDHHEKSNLVKFYKVTKRGLLHLIWDENDPQTQQQMVNELSKRYGAMFEFFRLWPSVIEVGLEQPSLEVLSSACERSLTRAIDRSQRPPKLLEPRDPTPIFLNLFRLGTVIGTLQDRARWQERIKRSTTLKEATARVLRQRALRDLEAVNEVLRYLSERELAVGTAADDIRILEQEIEQLQFKVKVLETLAEPYRLETVGKEA
jgi:hypothetical protein